MTGTTIGWLPADNQPAVKYLTLIWLLHRPSIDPEARAATEAITATGRAKDILSISQDGPRRVIAAPIEACIGQMCGHNVRINGLEGRITVLNLALSSVQSKTDFAVSGMGPKANALAPTEYVMKSLHVVFDGSVAIETTTIPKLVSDYSISRVDFLRLDCEGCEYDVLRNLPGDVRTLINEIVLEYHKGPSDLEELMNKYDFSVISEETGGFQEFFIRSETAAGIDIYWAG